MVTSHLLGEVERICDSLVAIDGGRLLRAAPISADDRGQRRARGRGQRGRGRAGRRGSTALGPAGAPATGGCCWSPLDDEATYDVVRDVVADLGPAAAPARPAPPPGAELFRPTRAGPRRGRPPAESASRAEPASSTTSATSATTGPRLGRGYAARSLYVHGLRAAFGLGRRQGEDLPVAAWSASRSSSPSIVVAVRSQTGDRAVTYCDVRRRPSRSLIIVLRRRRGARAGLARPARRVLPLYFSRPLHRDGLRAAKLGALMTAALFVLMAGPQLLDALRRRRSLEPAAASGPRPVDLLPGSASALLCALLLAGDRPAHRVADRPAGFGVAAIVAVFLITTPVVSAIAASIAVDAGQPARWPASSAGLFSPMTLVDGVEPWLFGGRRHAVDRTVRGHVGGLRLRWSRSRLVAACVLLLAGPLPEGGRDMTRLPDRARPSTAVELDGVAAGTATSSPSTTSR